MIKLIKSLWTWSHTPTGDTIIGVILFLLVIALLFSTPLWV